MKRLLFHTCCGPCLIYPGETLSRDFEITSYYYNPNIHPTTEYIRRLDTLAWYCERLGYELIAGEYQPALHLRAAVAADGGRCAACYRLRLEETARYAAENGYGLFSTTLTVSPYQDHDLIGAIGAAAAERHGVAFVYRDFRAGYREGQAKARELEMYRQPYCGCIYSEFERYEKKLKQAESGVRA